MARLTDDSDVKEAYIHGLKPLDVADSQILSNTTIVGMRFYPGSFDSLANSVSTVKRSTEFYGFMFIVPEVNNASDVNAVMLHDGKQKIGSVSSVEAPALKRMFERWRSECGYSEVVVARFSQLPDLNTQYELENFKRLGSLKVDGMYRVNERLARKYAAKFNV